MSPPPVVRLRGTSVQIPRPMVELVEDKGPCLCTVQAGFAGQCTADAMRVTAEDYASGRRLL